MYSPHRSPTRDLPVYSIVPEPLRYRVLLILMVVMMIIIIIIIIVGRRKSDIVMHAETLYIAAILWYLWKLQIAVHFVFMEVRTCHIALHKINYI
jgi:hypothetical protein